LKFLSRKSVLLVAAALSASTVAACSSSNSHTTTGATATTVALSGTPIKVGWIDIEGSLGINFTAQREAAQDEVTDLNATGGIGGHPVQLVSCVTQAASGGADCANQMVQAKATVVINFSTIDTASMYPILKAAGIPLIGGGSSPASAADLVPDGNKFFITGGPLVQYGTGDVFMAQTLKLKSVGVIYGSAASAQQAANAFIKTPLEGMGVKVQTVAVSESNPDYTAAINTVSNDDGLIALLACSAQDAVIKQAVALGYKGKLFGCDAPSDLQALGSAAANMYGGQQVKSVPDSPNDPDVKAFVAFAHKYNLDQGFYNESVYALLQTVKYAIQMAGGPSATEAQIDSALQSSSHWPIPLLSSSGLSCSTPGSKLVPTACNTDTLFVQIQPDGKSIKAVSGFLPAA
jgi:branched-chain amino acid transport system substrate-binding protein